MEPPEPELLSTSLSWFITPDITVIVATVVMVLLLGLSALISGSEVAFFSLGAQQLRLLNEDKKGSASRVLDLLSRPKRLLATILIANNFVNVGIVILSSLIVGGIFNMNVLSPAAIFLIQVIAVTFLLVLLGEVLPKVYATKNALKLASFMATPLIWMRVAFKPLNELLVRSTSFIDKKFERRSTQVSVDALGHALELTRDEQTTDEEQRILRGIVNFGNIEVRQVMRPRTDVIAISSDVPFSKILEDLLSSGYSRVPIFDGSLDKVVGVLYIKDLLPHLDQKEMDWLSLARKPFFVPENKKLDDLLRDFQEKKVHLAIVVDEYGGTSGIITLEDVIEEIVGDITDEYDDEDILYSKLDDSTFVFEGKIALNDMYRLMEVEGHQFEENKGGSETLGGFILELTGRFPSKHERIDFRNFTFIIESADERRIRRVKVIRKDAH